MCYLAHFPALCLEAIAFLKHYGDKYLSYYVHEYVKSLNLKEQTCGVSDTLLPPTGPGQSQDYFLQLEVSHNLNMSFQFNYTEL